MFHLMSAKGHDSDQECPPAYKPGATVTKQLNNVEIHSVHYESRSVEGSVSDPGFLAELPPLMDHYPTAGTTLNQRGPLPPLCRFFSKGTCKFGSKCASTHALPRAIPNLEMSGLATRPDDYLRTSPRSDGDGGLSSDDISVISKRVLHDVTRSPTFMNQSQWPLDSEGVVQNIGDIADKASASAVHNERSSSRRLWTSDEAMTGVNKSLSPPTTTSRDAVLSRMRRFMKAYNSTLSAPPRHADQQLLQSETWEKIYSGDTVQPRSSSPNPSDMELLTRISWELVFAIQDQRLGSSYSRQSCYAALRECLKTFTDTIKSEAKDGMYCKSAAMIDVKRVLLGEMFCEIMEKTYSGQQLPAMRSFDQHDTAPVLRLFERSSAWKWLVGRLRVASKTFDHRSPILPFSPRVSVESNYTFVVQWDPWRLAAELAKVNDSQKIAGMVVTVAHADTYHACTCAQYLEDNWPGLGSRLLEVIEDLVSRSERKSTERATIWAPYAFTDFCNIRQEHGFLNVRVIGTHLLIIAIGELLCWLAAAANTQESVPINIICSPSIHRISIHDTFVVEASSSVCLTAEGYKSSYLPTQDACCWRSLFHTINIAGESHVPIPDQGACGMEMPFDILLTLGETHWATTFNNKFMLKGFSSLYYPTRCTSEFIVWHFVAADDFSYIPHQAAFASCLGREAMPGGNISWLYKRKHYVGWVSKAETHAGTELAKYDFEESDAHSTRSDPSLEEIRLGYCKYLTVDTDIFRRQYQFPGWSVPYSEYLRDMVQASRHSVLLYDTAEERGWLVAATSALLHITIAQLKTGLEAKYYKSDALNRIKYAVADVHNAALEALLDKANRKIVLLEEDNDDDDELLTPGQNARIRRSRSYTFQHLVHENWKRLAQILELHAIKPAAMQLDCSNRDHLTGWSISNLVNSDPSISPRILVLRAAESDCNWSTLVKSANAAVLFGADLGDIIRPPTDLEVCKRWSTVPIWHGSMTVTVSHLRHIAKSKGFRFPYQLAEHVHWPLRNEDLFAKCQCSQQGFQACNHFQQLSSCRVDVSPGHKILDLPDQAAIVFANYDQTKQFDLLQDMAVQRDTPSPCSSLQETESSEMDSEGERQSRQLSTSSISADVPMQTDEPPVVKDSTQSAAFPEPQHVEPDEIVYECDRPLHPMASEVVKRNLSMKSFITTIDEGLRRHVQLHDSRVAS